MRNQQRTVLIALLLLLTCVPSRSNADASGNKQYSCPIISIVCSSNKSCCGPKYNFTANIVGGHAARKPTYKWSISSGKIAKGQGTGSIDVDANCSDGKPITVTVEIGNVIPDGCPSTASYTTECEKQ
jgi:hypothetical protein